MSPTAIESTRNLGVNICGSNIDIAKSSDIVIIAVKPHHVASVAKEISPFVRDRVVVSIATLVQLKTSFYSIIGKLI